MRRPTAVISENVQFRDHYVKTLRRRRRPAIDAGDAYEIARIASELPLGAIVIEVTEPRHWHGCRLLRASPALADTPLIVLGEGAGHSSNARLARELGCVAYVHKPVALAIVLEVLERLGR